MRVSLLLLLNIFQFEMNDGQKLVKWYNCFAIITNFKNVNLRQI